MNLSGILKFLSQDLSFQALIKDTASKHTFSARIPESAKPAFIASLYHSLNQPVLVVTSHPDGARKMFEQISAWTGFENIKLFPESDNLPYQRLTSDKSTENDRLQVLSSLARKTHATPLIIASVPALMNRVPAPGEFKSSSFWINTGENIDPLLLMKKLVNLGYEITDTVEVPGMAARRGGIVDIFPPSEEDPVRLEFFGNTVESIRSFEPKSQISIKSITSVLIELPQEMAWHERGNAEVRKLLENLNRDSLNEEIKLQIREELSALLEHNRPRDIQFYYSLFNEASIFDYLPQHSLVILDETINIENSAQTHVNDAEIIREKKVAWGELPLNFPAPYFNWQTLQKSLAQFQNLTISAFGADEQITHVLNFNMAPAYAEQVENLIVKTKQWLSRQKRIIIVSQQAPRLAEIFAESDIHLTPGDTVGELHPGSISLIQGSLSDGWIYKDNVYLLTDKELFGFVKQRRAIRKRQVPYHRFLSEITPGDYIVHIEHGVGKFTGIITRENGTKREYLILQYAGGDKLYVPSDQIDRVNRYIGAGDQPPVLSRLGTQEWVKTRQKAKESAEEIAKELINLYAAREIVPGYAYSPDTVWQQEFEASFPYVETPDQLQVQASVKEDMEKSKPMDRLVVGDVGYGKTEIALRAAFKAVMDSKQVAILVPTTVLAQQHYSTFTQRMNAFPIKIEVLSRFRSPKEQKNIIEGLADGSIDICIGTHRLIQKDVIFKKLGLIVIDEEQRFGVGHKEYLKQLRKEVDVLTLTATPIPRTLHLSLTGVRDMSVIETPPEDRLPIKTYVSPYDDEIIREAIVRELERNGQVFFVHNRVQSINIMANHLQELVPEARILIGHGQMPEEKLEEVMADFAAGKADVLVCTTIIESGLDMPNVNTLIINKADKFGLTQLYQLRGRVGRGSELAYAYFLFDKGKQLSHIAEKRLQTIFEATELGAGFNIAMKDLEIRGAGTLLGTKQSGHINALGFTLYCQILSEAVEAQKAKLAGKEVTVTQIPEPNIDLPLTSFIPEKYIENTSTRLNYYHKLLELKNPGQIKEVSDSLIDRFGRLPVEVANLLYSVKIKLMARRAGIESILHHDNEIFIRLIQGLTIPREKQAIFLKNKLIVTQSQVRLNIKSTDWQNKLENIILTLSR